ncbi:MAG: hypothetical protein GF308_15745 [Candidatus Heimdallarchaeota archaeon]|nr:hypothetical protein [Candidatus Heimdallarchaeota archaeon]
MVSKKIHPKIAALALVLLSFLAAGGLAIKNGIAPQGGGSGWEPGDTGSGGGGN